MRALTALAALALASGCNEVVDADAGVDAGACVAEPAELELGTGTDGSLRNYRALSDGDAVVLTPGFQGGQHIWVALRGRGFNPSLPRIELRAYRPADDDILIGRLVIRLPMVAAPEDPSRLALPSQTLVVDDREYCSVLGREVRIELRFNDLDGRCRTLRRTVLLADIDPAVPETLRRSWRRCCDERLPRCYAPMDGGAPDASPDASLDTSPD